MKQRITIIYTTILFIMILSLISCTKDSKEENGNVYPNVNHNSSYIVGNWAYDIDENYNVLLEFEVNGTYKKTETEIFDFIPNKFIEEGIYNYDEDTKVLLCQSEKTVDKFRVKSLSEQSMQLEHYDSESNSYEEPIDFSRITSKNNVKLTECKIYKITDDSVGIAGNITNYGNITIKEKGICYSQTPNPTIENHKIVSRTDVINETITDFEAETLYYVRLYAITSDHVYYGDVTSFTTLKSEPKIEFSDILFENIATSTAMVKGYVYEKGICYSTHLNPTDLDKRIVSSTNEIEIQLTELEEGKEYHVRLYAITEMGTFYGEDKGFTTRIDPVHKEDKSLKAKISRVMWNLDYTNNIYVYVKGEYPGGINTNIKAGFCASTSPYPTITDRTTPEQIIGSASVGSFGVNPNQTYYIRPYHVSGSNVTYYESTKIQIGKDAKVSFNFVENASGIISYTVNTNNTYKISVVYGRIYETYDTVVDLGYVSKGTGSKSFYFGANMWSYFQSCIVVLYDINDDISYEAIKSMGRKRF